MNTDIPAFPKEPLWQRIKTSFLESQGMNILDADGRRFAAEKAEEDAAYYARVIQRQIELETLYKQQWPHKKLPWDRNLAEVVGDPANVDFREAVRKQILDYGIDAAEELFARKKQK